MKKTIVIFLFLFSLQQLQAQNIQGRVADNITNQPLVGAVITLPNGQKLITDDNGKFQLHQITNNLVVTVSSLGYETQQVTIKPANKELLILLTPTTDNLNKVQVTGWATGKRDNQLTEAQSVGVLTYHDLQRGNGLFPETQMNTIPGVFMQTRGISGGQRIIIRGYGNTTNFNGLGYQFFLNNIPLTDATGVTILDDIDFSTIGRVEVFKGPESSLYGSGIAGVVKLYSIQPKPNTTKILEENTVGSYGLYRNNTRIESAGSNSVLFFNYGHQTSNGYRSHSASAKDYASFKGDFYVGDQQTISTYLSYSRSYEELAGEIPGDTLYRRITWSDPKYVNNNAHVLIESFRAGITDDIKINQHFNNQTTVFTSGYTLDQPFAAGLNSNAVLTFGGRTGFIYNGKSGAVGIHGIIGGQFEKTLSFNKTYNLTNGIMGGIRGDLQIQASTYNLFTEWKLNLPAQIMLTAGSSVNFIEYSIRDMLTNSANPTHADQSGYKRFTPVLKPRIAVLKMLNKNSSVYVDVSTGYTPPTTSNVVIPAIGKVNTGLQPELGIQYELGTKGSFFNNKLSYQMALFQLDVSNKIVNQSVAATQTTPFYTFAVNVGKQRNNGVELSLNYLALQSNQGFFRSVKPFVTYTYSNFKYVDFKSDNNNNANTLNFSGNKVAGVAPNFLNIGLDVVTAPGIYFNSTFQYVDKVPYTFDNLNNAAAYRLLGAKFGYRQTLHQHFDVDAFIGADNLLNNTYYTFLFLSPTLASQTDPHFIPGPYTAMWYGGLKLAYHF
ncbi:MAG: TonB-dependent receptor [Hydrotalea flava]|nr:TonB-dependent receptor [Hydrotalea flava]NIM38243.1 TonB-dependent receptor [Hydrotalea flava]NIN03407.1 TonB-dependent receptor [Hydrotalea flava]NIN15101.1 TonB-dependent receptor [Hydrotalea flava]NIO94169.1 TonB-dependent receptor [Hydrotalea flava]